MKDERGRDYVDPDRGAALVLRYARGIVEPLLDEAHRAVTEVSASYDEARTVLRVEVSTSSMDAYRILVGSRRRTVDALDQLLRGYAGAIVLHARTMVDIRPTGGLVQRLQQARSSA